MLLPLSGESAISSEAAATQIQKAGWERKSIGLLQMCPQPSDPRSIIHACCIPADSACLQAVDAVVVAVKGGIHALKCALEALQSLVDVFDRS